MEGEQEARVGARGTLVLAMGLTGCAMVALTAWLGQECISLRWMFAPTALAGYVILAIFGAMVRMLGRQAEWHSFGAMRRRPRPGEPPVRPDLIAAARDLRARMLLVGIALVIVPSIVASGIESGLGHSCLAVLSLLAATLLALVVARTLMKVRNLTKHRA